MNERTPPSDTPLDKRLITHQIDSDKDVALCLSCPLPPRYCTGDLGTCRKKWGKKFGKWR